MRGRNTASTTPEVLMFRSLTVAPLALTAALTLAACTPDGVPMATAPAPAAPPAVIMPTAETQRITRTSGSSTTVVSPDGRSTSTTTTSTSVSVDPGALLAALSGGAVAPTPPNRAADFLGDWRLSNLQNRDCGVRLSAPIGTQDFGFAQIRGCTGPQLGFVSRWGLRNGEVHLMNGFGTVLVRLRVTAPNRLDGDGVTMSR